MLKRIPGWLPAASLLSLIAINTPAATLVGPSLQSGIGGLAGDAGVGTDIAALDAGDRLKESHLQMLALDNYRRHFATGD